MVRYLCPIFLFLFTLGAHAQVEPSSQPETPRRNRIVRVEVGLVQVDAVVTDSDGRPVTDLTADDFVVYQDGKPQEITNFSMVRTDTTPLPLPAIPESSEEPEWSVTPVPPPTSSNLVPARDKIRRTIALVVDDLGLSFEGTVRTREALEKWVKTEMRPGDLVAVILTGSGMGSLQQFTTDKRLLLAAIDRIYYNLSGRVGVSSFAPISDVDWGLTGYAADERNMILTEGTVGAIQYVLHGLKDVPGRKSLILFSEDMRVFVGGSGRDFFMRSPLQKLIDEANRSAVVIHAIDPRGVVYTGPTAEDNLSGLSTEGGIADVIGDRETQLLSSQDGMVQLTEYTGGLFEHNRNNIDDALVDVVNDGEVYYLIGYQPDSETAENMQKGYREFHSIKVRLKRKGLKIRSRSGFFGTTDAPAEPRTRRDVMREALYSPFSSGELPVRLTALFSQAQDGKVRINALLHFDADQLSFTEEDDGWQKAVVEVVATTFDAKGEQVDLAGRAWTITAKGESFEKLKRNGIVALLFIPVTKPGAYQTRVVVSDTASELMGTASNFINVPDVKKGNLALSGIALASEKKQLETLTGDQEMVAKDREVNGTVAVRIFKPGDTILWAYQILNAKLGKENQSQLQAYVRLFRDGRRIYSADPEDMSMALQENSTRLIGTGKMELKKIMPGEYALQVVVLDKLASKKHRVAEQSINFSIQESNRMISEAR